MQDSNQILRFLFEESDIRGEIVTLDSAFEDSVAAQKLHPKLIPLYGEFFAAAALLSDMLKFDGTITLQARGDGPISIIMAEANNEGNLRGIVDIANPDALLTHDTGELKPLGELLGKGMLSLTLDPTQGQRYQGIVPLERATLGECIEHYFDQSEQLPTFVRLYQSEGKCGGVFLQCLPAQIVTDSEERQNQWHTACQLAATLGAEELFNTNHETLLFRLFHELNCRIFEPKQLQYRCSCSRERCEKTLASLGEGELRNILEERETIEMNCQFCGTSYAFVSSDIAGILGDQPTLH